MHPRDRTLAATETRSAPGVVRLRSERGTDDDVSKAIGRDRYDRNLGIAYDVNPAVNNS
jgi:hypothetical protein